MFDLEPDELDVEPDEPNVTYDRWGRMNYNPMFHGKQNQPWTTTDQSYLIKNYELDGPEAVSLALERTIHTVMQRASELRKQGLMEKPDKKTFHKRILKIKPNCIEVLE